MKGLLESFTVATFVVLVLVVVLVLGIGFYLAIVFIPNFSPEGLQTTFELTPLINNPYTLAEVFSNMKPGEEVITEVFVRSIKSPEITENFWMPVISFGDVYQKYYLVSLQIGALNFEARRSYGDYRNMPPCGSNDKGYCTLFDSDYLGFSGCGTGRVEIQSNSDEWSQYCNENKPFTIQGETWKCCVDDVSKYEENEDNFYPVVRCGFDSDGDGIKEGFCEPGSVSECPPNRMHLTDKIDEGNGNLIDQDVFCKNELNRQYQENFEAGDPVLVLDNAWCCIPRGAGKTSQNIWWPDESVYSEDMSSVGFPIFYRDNQRGNFRVSVGG